MKDRLELISLILSVTAAFLAIVSQSQNFILSIYYAPQILWALCVAGMMFFTSRLIWPSRNQATLFSIDRREPSAQMKSAGVLLFLLSPIIGLLVWYFTMRIPTDKMEQFQWYVRSGDKAVKYRMHDQAVDQYEKALKIDPRRIELRNKIVELRKQQGDPR
ncbi:MAG TPA: hypothetical protein VGB77_20025 [Abditibacteriaceae bacterium]|jgi:hypothetical protein